MRNGAPNVMICPLPAVLYQLPMAKVALVNPLISSCPDPSRLPLPDLSVAGVGILVKLTALPAGYTGGPVVA